MKTNLIPVILIALLILSACSKENTSTTTSQNSTGSTRAVTLKPKVKFKFPGQNGSPCDVGACGQCIGICISFNFVLDDTISSAESADGQGFVNLSFQFNNTKMKIRCTRSCDNGDGKTRFLSDFYMTTSVANFLGFNSVFVKHGIYPIDYSSNPFGDVTVDVTTN